MGVCWRRGQGGRAQTSSVFIAPLSPPQRRNPCIAKNKLRIAKSITKHPPKKQGCASHAPLLFVSKDYLLLPNRVEFLRQAPLGRRFALAPFEAVSIAVVVALRNHVADVHVELAVRLRINRQPAVVLDALGALLPLHLQFVILHGLGVRQVGHDGVLADGLEVRVGQHRAGPVAPVLLNRVGNRVQDGNPSTRRGDCCRACSPGNMLLV